MPKFTRAEIRTILGDAHTEDIENKLIALHLGVVDPLKDDVQKYKADADKLPNVQKELNELKAAGDGGYKEKYEAEVTAHNAYKQQVQREKDDALATDDILAMCKEAGITRESALNLIVKAFDRSTIKRGEDKKITNREELVTAMKTEYADFVATGEDKNLPPNNPPSGGGSDLGKLDMASYIAARKKK